MLLISFSLFLLNHRFYPSFPVLQLRVSPFLCWKYFLFYNSMSYVDQAMQFSFSALFYQNLKFWSENLRLTRFGASFHQRSQVDSLLAPVRCLERRGSDYGCLVSHLGCQTITDIRMLATITESDPRNPLISVKSEWRFPIPLLLFLRLQLELGTSGEGPLSQITPLNYTRATQHSIPKSSHLILVGGLLISYSFSLLLGWSSSEVTSFSWNCFLGPYLLHFTRICWIQLVLC